MEEKEKNELSDILIKEEGAKGGGMKNVLLFSAIALLIFFVGILVFKLLDDTSGTQKPAPLPPAPKGEKEVKPLFQPVETKDAQTEANEQLDEIIRKAKEAKAAAMEKKEEAKPELPPVKEEPARPEPPMAKPEPKPLPAPAPAEEEKVMAPAKPVPAASAPIPATKSYYVQVASLSRFNPDKRFLEVIEKHGFHYKVADKTINGKAMKRVYIGPFATKAEAQKALGPIRESIQPGAFIIRDY